MSSTSIAVELDTIRHSTGAKEPQVSQAVRRASRTSTRPSQLEENVPPNAVVVEQVLHWNKPAINIYRLGAAFWSFIILGMNDGAIGVSSHTCKRS
jgi:hypothetical protein